MRKSGLASRIDAGVRSNQSLGLRNVVWFLPCCCLQSDDRCRRSVQPEQRQVARQANDHRQNRASPECRLAQSGGCEKGTGGRGGGAFAWSAPFTWSWYRRATAFCFLQQSNQASRHEAANCRELVGCLSTLRRSSIRRTKAFSLFVAVAAGTQNISRFFLMFPTILFFHPGFPAAICRRI